MSPDESVHQNGSGIDALLHALRDDCLDDEGFARLEALIVSDRMARQRYVRYILLMAELMTCRVSASRFVPHLFEPSTEELLREVIDEERLAAQRRRRDEAQLKACRRRWTAEREERYRLLLPSDDPPIVHQHIVIPYVVAYGTLAGVAAILVLLVWPLLFSEKPQAFAPQQVPKVAVLDHSLNAHWDSGAEDLVPGTKLEPGELTLLSGVAQLTFTGGAQVIIEAPAQFELSSSSQMRLRHGRLSAVVPHKASGFTVETPAARLIDRGTEFCVIVSDPRYTELDVITGAVDAGFRPESNRSDTSYVRVPAESARRFDGISRTVETIASQPERFRSSWDDVLYRPVLTGDLRFIRENVESLALDEFESEQASVLLERRRVRLEEDQPVTANGPGFYYSFADDKILAAGTRVDSYLVHFDGPGSILDEQRGLPARVRGSIQFSRPILGVIATSEELARSSQWFGRDQTRYASPETAAGLGLEDKDTILISSDRLMISFELQAAAYDQMRILVEAAE